MRLSSELELGRVVGVFDESGSPFSTFRKKEKMKKKTELARKGTVKSGCCNMSHTHTHQKNPVFSRQKWKHKL